MSTQKLKFQLAGLNNRIKNYQLKKDYSPEYLLWMKSLAKDLQDHLDEKPADDPNILIIKKLLLILQIHNITFPTIAQPWSTLEIIYQATQHNRNLKEPVTTVTMPII